MSPRGRAIWLKAWLVAMALSTLNALRIVLTDWPAFVAAFPDADGPVARGFAVALPLALLIALSGLWAWRRWALWSIAAAVCATLAFDLLSRGPWLHLAAALSSSAVLAALLWWNRARFAREAPP